MRRSKRTAVSVSGTAQQTADHNHGTELTATWKSLSQSKAALRHIENHLEAGPGTAVLMESTMDRPKKKSGRTVRRRDGQQVEDGVGSSKNRGRRQTSPKKSSSRSPLRNATQDSNVRKSNSVEFREPLASYREATPSPHPSPQLEACNLQSVPASSCPSSPPPSDPLLSSHVYHRDTSALESTEVRYLNDEPALEIAANQSHMTDSGGAKEESTLKAQFDLSMDGHESSPRPDPASCTVRRAESTSSTSPGSASQRLENLRRHQLDDKLEKLKERIRRQRQHLEESAEKEKDNQEQPIMAGARSNTGDVPTVRVRKVATAPPAPIYKGFNRVETKIRTPDGKILKEDDFHHFTRKIYRDLSHQFAECTRSRHQPPKEQKSDGSKERRPSKPVRKVHRPGSPSDLNAKPVISPASWREGQKLVKTVLGPVPKLPTEDRPPTDGRLSRTASRHRSSSGPRSESNHGGRPKSTDRSRNAFPGQSRSHHTSTPSSAAQDKTPVGVGGDLLSADIRGILDDLQLESKAAKDEERAPQRSSSSRRGRGGSLSQTRSPISAWGPAVVAGCSSRGCRSASPSARRPHTSNMADAGQKKRHYDADTVRHYIAKQQEERKRRKAEEKKALREEAERRNQRLQELYRRQREVGKTVAFPSEAPIAPVQKRLQETYNKLLLEEAQLGDEDTQTQPAAPASPLRPMYQPSGESDKENKRLELPQSPSSSDRSLNDRLTPPLSRHDLDVGGPSAPGSGALASFGDHLLSQLLRLDSAVSSGDINHAQRPATAPVHRSQSRMSRIEAIKATAASLSSRIESEARKLAGEGMNYGAATSLDVDAGLVPRSSPAKHLLGPSLDDGHWAELAAHVTTDNNDIEMRIQRILTSTSHSLYNDTALPGAGNLHAFSTHAQNNGTHGNLSSPQTNPSYIGERGRLLNGSENGAGDNRANFHDSSAGSISEGSLLSEGSLSPEETSPPRPANHQFHNAAHSLEAVERGAGHRRDYPRLSEFQKEAAKCSSFSSALTQQGSSGAAWEELNKGSPLSVINIFTKNLQCHVKVSEKNSPSPQSLHSGHCPGDAAVYEDDFVSSHSSGGSGPMKRRSKSHSVNSHVEELIKRSPYEKNTGDSSQHSSFHSPHISSGSISGSSPLSKCSARKSGTASDHSVATLLGDERGSCSPPSKGLSSDSRQRSSDISSVHTVTSGPSHRSLGLDGKKSAASRPRLASPSVAPPGGESPSERNGSVGGTKNTNKATSDRRAEARTAGELQYSPAVLQQRMAAELQYLDCIEESVRQLGDVERLMGVSMAQQDSVAMAQMLKSNQQRHERDLYELKIQAEREALEAQLQMEENRQRVARAHIELQESLAATQKETLEGLQDATTKMMSQQAEAARYTAETARHIKEMTELARSQMAAALTVTPAAADSAKLSQHQLQRSDSKSDSESFQSEDSSRSMRREEPVSSLNSFSRSDSVPFAQPDISSHCSTSADHTERAAKEADEKQTGGKAESTSIEEDVLTAANDSICSDSIHSVMEEKGESTSIATEYSLKFDESMTEDEIEEHSFRSVLPSEAHRRGTLEKKPRHHEESEDDGTDHNSVVTGSHSILKSANIPFAGGQDSFSQFTMDMVRQYMKDEEVRLQHQSSLLGLRQKALKEKIRTELVWLEHQKKQLRDKGEDDKMPPIRKKQRGLLMRLQQEQAEIKRLQEANKAARKERQLLLKQQEEIVRMRSSTLRLKERLKSAAPSDIPVIETPAPEASSPNMRLADDVRTSSPSPSVSGSETSSIMQKLKKMRSHMDEKFLTKREQQLMHRRRHAEELLQWKQRLDQEEAEVRRMEKEALAGWDKDHVISQSPKKERCDISLSSSHHRSSAPRTDSEKEYVSEVEGSSATPSSIHTEVQESNSLRSPSSTQPASLPEAHLASIQSSPANYTQDFTSASPSASRRSSPLKGSHSSAPSPSDSSSKTKIQLPSSQMPTQAPVQSTDTLTATQSEPISDQSDIESRIKALKEELRKRKFMACQLKKEQKKRNKERLKAQEASLLKQLESYNNYIEKTKAELNQAPDSAHDTKSQDVSVSDSRIKVPPHRSETSKTSERTQVDSSANHSAPFHPVQYRSTSAPEELSEDTPTVTPTPVCVSSQQKASERRRQQDAQIIQSQDENIVSESLREELEVDASPRLEDQHSERLLKLGMEKQIDTKETSPGQDQLKTRRSSESEESRQSGSLASIKSHSAAVEPKTSRHSSCDLATSDHSCLRDADVFSSKKEPPRNDVQRSSPLTDGYNDDFESTGGSSPTEHTSKSEKNSLTKDYLSPAMSYDSQDEDVEEEISKELSHHSGSSGTSHESGRLLDLHSQSEDSKHDSNGLKSSPVPPIPRLQSPCPPVADEMLHLNIGDRVLVGGVQPGTLRFKGPTSFASGFWAGVELDESEGSNDGSYDGVVYFECDKRHGIFAPPDKIAHLPDRFEVYSDVPEDEDSDELSDKSQERSNIGGDFKSSKDINLKTKSKEASQSNYGSRDKNGVDESVHISVKNLDPLKAEAHLNSHLDKQSKLHRSNDKNGDMMLEFKDSQADLLITDTADFRKEKELTVLAEREDARQQLISTDRQQRVLVDALTDKLLNNYVSDAVKQLTRIKKAKEQKIEACNQTTRQLFEIDDDEQTRTEQKDGLPFILPGEKEELSSPELCNRPESPVLGASGQEELAKRLAELELSRELVDELGDDQDWFDEDFGLSSRRQQQRLEEKQRREEEGAKLGGHLRRSGSSAGEALGVLVSSPDGDQQGKTPPRPALPLPLPPKLPELPAMVVPHATTEVEKMVHVAVEEIWGSCSLGNTKTLANVSRPKPSQEYLGEEARAQDQEALCIRSYRQCVYDLTWEILQDIYAEDPNAEQPLWMKSRRVRSSYFHRVKTPGDITKIQEFVTAEVLKLLGLAKDQNQKTDWQKMLKFGRKKRDRVDHILVQELHEEEAQWVNYDEDELFVKMQLADSIFDSLLKDTVNTLSLISDQRDKRDTVCGRLPT